MEIVAATKPSHTHKFEIKGNRGYCPCGEIREFLYEDNIAKNGVKIIQTGRPDYKDSPVLGPFPVKPVPASTVSPAASPSAQKVNKTARHELYEKHKWEILADIVSLGRPATEKKWKIPSGSMTGLKKAWKKDWPEIKTHATSRDKVSQSDKNTSKADTKLSKTDTECPEKDAYETADLSRDQIDNISQRLISSRNAPPASPTNKYIVGYWRKRADLKNTGAAERVIMTLTADMLEAKQ